ncbi:MAG: hypothetical protein NC177_05690 [Ruminococcus flavefaciens]|nr:hypothetical protein [Ruminococcus flavefaciens]
MAYADFPYYQDFFKGTLISDVETFRTFSERASEFVDTATFDRLADAELLSRHRTKIQKCVCALTEQFFKRNIAFSGGIPSDEDMPKTSESIGEYSISIANPYDYVQEISMTDEDFQKALKSTVLRYLGNTGLLFRGVK